MTFWGPNGTRCARYHYRTQKSLDFQGPPLKMAQVMDIARLKIITDIAIKTTGTLISSLGRYVFGSELSYNKAPPRLPGLGC
jgi:hypothetical protein